MIHFCLTQGHERLKRFTLNGIQQRLLVVELLHEPQYVELDILTYVMFSVAVVVFVDFVI